MGPESRFRQGLVRPFIKKLRHSWFTSIQQLSILGIPDILGCSFGRFVAVELKARGKQPTELQWHVLSLVEKAGGVTMVVDPDNWEAAKAFLKRLDEGEWNGRQFR